MAKARNSFKCVSCNATFSKWSGQCSKCGQWNTIEEAEGLSAGPAAVSLGGDAGKELELHSLTEAVEPFARCSTGISELDRPLGGGLVPASAILVGGDPGIGKSTLLLQAAAQLSRGETSVIYFSGEESISQIQMRAARLGLSGTPVNLAAATNLRDIRTTLDKARPQVAIIDSIQTVWADNVSSAPGSVSQVRTIVHEIVRFAKSRGTTVFLVGHVTKEGQIAGPRVVEHMVDTVLYFEGQGGHHFRILRASKNRFGPADEIGVFEMSGEGLIGVDNPSALFLSERDNPTPGSVVFAGIEGTRSLLVEIQALVAQSAYGTPRRTVIGWDSGRMAMVLAVLESRCGVSFLGEDVYLNIAGGIRITEPAADLAVAGALVSARYDRPLSANAAVFGEISLSGSIRPVPQPEQRLKEAQKLGFDQVFAPSRTKQIPLAGVRMTRLSDLAKFAGLIAANNPRGRAEKRKQ